MTATTQGNQIKLGVIALVVVYVVHIEFAPFPCFVAKDTAVFVAAKDNVTYDKKLWGIGFATNAAAPRRVVHTRLRQAPTGPTAISGTISPTRDNSIMTTTPPAHFMSDGLLSGVFTGNAAILGALLPTWPDDEFFTTLLTFLGDTFTTVKITTYLTPRRNGLLAEVAPSNSPFLATVRASNVYRGIGVTSYSALVGEGDSGTARLFRSQFIRTPATRGRGGIASKFFHSPSPDIATLGASSVGNGSPILAPQIRNRILGQRQPAGASALPTPPRPASPQCVQPCHPRLAAIGANNISHRAPTTPAGLGHIFFGPYIRHRETGQQWGSFHRELSPFQAKPVSHMRCLVAQTNRRPTGCWTSMSAYSVGLSGSILPQLPQAVKSRTTAT